MSQPKIIPTEVERSKRLPWGNSKRVCSAKSWFPGEGHYERARRIWNGRLAFESLVSRFARPKSEVGNSLCQLLSMSHRPTGREGHSLRS